MKLRSAGPARTDYRVPTLPRLHSMLSPPSETSLGVPLKGDASGGKGRELRTKRYLAYLTWHKPCSSVLLYALHGVARLSRNHTSYENITTLSAPCRGEIFPFVTKSRIQFPRSLYSYLLLGSVKLRYTTQADTKRSKCIFPSSYHPPLRSGLRWIHDRINFFLFGNVFVYLYASSTMYINHGPGSPLHESSVL